jgi:hypothetical protein
MPDVCLKFSSQWLPSCHGNLTLSFIVHVGDLTLSFLLYMLLERSGGVGVVSLSLELDLTQAKLCLVPLCGISSVLGWGLSGATRRTAGAGGQRWTPAGFAADNLENSGVLPSIDSWRASEHPED